MLCLTIRIKRNDEFNHKRLNKLIIEYFIKNKISGATVWTGVDGFGKRRRSTLTIEGITMNMPMIIEVIDEKSKLEPLLPDLKMMVDDNGLVTIHEVDVI
jgi:PII-like signaling protein